MVLGLVLKDFEWSIVKDFIIGKVNIWVKDIFKLWVLLRVVYCLRGVYFNVILFLN